MRVIPAIDLKDGLCVRLLQGRQDDSTIYSHNPVATALQWQSCGAKLIHVVDLDGAFTGDQKNLLSILQIREAVKVEIEVGGGIRDIPRIDQLLSTGIERVILGTVAIEKPELVAEACRRHPGRILVGIDARNGFVAVKGWVEVTQVPALDLALRMQDSGVAGIIYTDISKDGMLTGPNVEATADLVERLAIPVIASGGVSSLDDIRRLAAIPKLYGAITGKALYSGTLDLAEAIREAEAA
ncbi:MAG TPA: 1-(5-phosphoribosyl)-5-[(5-phosphoribosylamino)methylideneamino]imidazole-4-carboxamide isomerase [Dissulfurispiraceae bacterium]|nr:1-(5-phosphoribosyl)-5-[(5-phosphoribosylamino)methylideneamino]imidazole-4-carboxamide isomerase [Dissulfurispiraceae bacterium]